MRHSVILVKHSQPAIVEHLPAREWHLSQAGISRAQHLADRLRSFAPEILISSSEPKARETAEIVAEKLDLGVQVMEGLQEHDRSATPYLSQDAFQTAVREFFLHPDRLVLGGETAAEAYVRFSTAVQAILESYPKQTIVIISHGTVISLFVSRLTGISDFTLWTQLGLPGFVVLDRKSKTVIAQENIL